MAEHTEAEAVAELSCLAQKPAALKPGDLVGILIPEGTELLHSDFEQYLPIPKRKSGLVVVHDADSFTEYVDRHGEAGRTAIFADIDMVGLTAVLNGHMDNYETAGWGDHRVELRLRNTPNWLHWSAKDTNWMSQTAFAEHIEEGLIDIVEPTAADMLEMAQTFQSHAKVAFRSSTLLQSGQRQFTYEETIDAKAGQQGTMVVPAQFILGLAVFEGQSEGHRIRARLQHRIEGDNLKLRYLIDRSADVVKAAFDGVVKAVEEGTSLKAYRGSAP